MDKELEQLVDRLRDIRKETQAILSDLTPEELNLTWQGEGYLRGRTIRQILQGMADHERDHLYHLFRARVRVGLRRTELNRYLGDLEAARADLLGNLLGIGDEKLDQEWEAGEWTIRQIVSHMGDVEEEYRNRIQTIRGRQT
ncbi:MAG: DinB family protein [Chloroflexi bacterium]|nr:DinB family protein [Chloroflexota bacterium]